MASDLRVVIDTNVVVSAVLLPRSTPRQAFDRAIEKSQLLLSNPILAELSDVLARPKFDRYIPARLRAEFLAALIDKAELVTITAVVTDCRDPKDNKYLELAVSGRASHILTGDADLLALHPYAGVSIIQPQAFLQELPEPDPEA